ncbi:MAG: hypothetical protein HYY61_06330 [Deltaproteobacteria bacterium]|nr:hypothetical protein [Deltaproteobacteria bacterium]
MARLINGQATIELDPRFLESVTMNEYLPPFIQITPAGPCQGLYVSQESETGFRVSELRDGKSNIKFYWRVEAYRRGLEGAEFISPSDYQHIKSTKKK